MSCALYPKEHETKIEIDFFNNLLKKSQGSQL